jgi:D-alanyl-D-alanine carboxypeptidase
LAATLTATEVMQQQYCDTASPPSHLPMPVNAPMIRISPPGAPTAPLPATAIGPRLEGADPPPKVTASHVAIVDDVSGALLFEHDGFGRAAPASITKIVNTIVALEHEPDIRRVYTTTVSASALVACDGSSVMGMEPNQHLKLETLLYGMMLPSGNDAAEQVAVSLAGSRETYVGWMNDRVASLGLHDTHFVTPSGMDADEHYSSAYDMAMLGRYAMQNPTFRILAAARSFVGDHYPMQNLNPLLSSYEGADGVKIGYTEIADHTIVGSVMRDGHRVYIALLGSRALLGDSALLFDWVWKTYRW